MTPLKSKLVITKEILEGSGYTTEKNLNIGLLSSMFLSCITGQCGGRKTWHTLYVKTTDDFRYVCNECNSTVTYVG